jgi:hypothetical protein
VEKDGGMGKEEIGGKQRLSTEIGVNKEMDGMEDRKKGGRGERQKVGGGTEGGVEKVGIIKERKGME